MGDIQWKKKHKKGEGKGQTRGIRGEGDLGVEEETQGARHGECGGEVCGVGCVDSVHCASHSTHTPTAHTHTRQSFAQTKTVWFCGTCRSRRGTDVVIA